ncbi:uncharacterized protein [Diadema antillarum]|uniref:uncharacterized protein n=1 Tax=Diadema antillarum TaxID=105358 RepID=UPI003A848D51
MADSVITEENMPEKPGETQRQQSESAGKDQEQKEKKKKDKERKKEEKKKRKEEKKKKKKEKKKKRRRVTVTVGTTGGSERVAGLIALLRSMDDVVKSVNFREIPYNVRDMDQFEFDDVNVFILCHSITNRRLSITDVPDSLYDQLLKTACRALGNKKVIIVAYDFKDNELEANVLASSLNAFRIKQPTACRKSSAVVFAGQCASSPPELPEDQLEQLCSSLKGAVSARKRGFSGCFKTSNSN